MSRLIGINGLKTAGKDTTYEVIASMVPGTKRAGFADKLKIMAMLALGYNGEPAELIAAANRLKEDGGYVDSAYIAPAVNSGALIPHGEHISGREYLQRFGGYAREVFGKEFWVDQVLPQPDRFYDRQRYGLAYLSNVIDPWTRAPRGDFNVLCITDVRYPNEAERVLALGGQVWEVRRPGVVSDGHASEEPLPRDLVHVIIENDGTLDDLRRRVEAWV